MRVFCAIALSMAFLSVADVRGEGLDPRITLFCGGSFFKGERVFTVNGSPLQSEFEKGVKAGVRGTTDIGTRWAVEAAYSFGRHDLRISELEVPDQGRRFRMSLHEISTNLLYYFASTDGGLRTFATAGLGLARFSPTSRAKALALDGKFIDDPARIVSDNKFSVNMGGGFEGRASRRVAVRFDIRDHMIKETPARSDGIFFPVKGSVHQIEVLAGVIFYLR